MKTQNIGVFLLLLCASISFDSVNAGDKLGKNEVVELLSGNTINGYFVKQGEAAGFTGQVRLKIKFFNNGGAEKTTYPADSRKGSFIEKGKWWLNKKGGLCLSWTQENKKRCGALKKQSNGKYILQRKKQKIFIEKIVAGTS